MGTRRCLGIQQFYIYDNNSSRPLLELLWPYVEAGVVEYSYFKGWHTRQGPSFVETPQFWAYEDCGARWVGAGRLHMAGVCGGASTAELP
jgi:hypothetical protein